MSYLTQTSRFLNDAAGLEKTLRLLQALTQICASYAPNPQPWLQARKQIALGRRYFRPGKIVPAFTASASAFHKPPGTSISLLNLLDSTRWLCQGLYILLESFTLLDAMGVCDHEWADWLFIEGQKFWFYAIFHGVVIGLLELLMVNSTPIAVPTKTKESSKTEEDEKNELEQKSQIQRNRRLKVMKQLVVDGCDLFVPGPSTGWLVVSSTKVGVLMTVSSVVAGTDIWERVQGSG
ncbi:peroxisomal biogenesis factor 11 [Amylocarpus encephaloides]|uniref:Peroxisomal biogenesis factor 11 n=1 Tax=Amylocarpus encephaloides TaxID=45428 RepID=A0A9P7Y6C7_9HELO|nr:peroxisomal biogenesis factor 11 [Amylocarpus encephaloides]